MRNRLWLAILLLMLALAALLVFALGRQTRRRCDFVFINRGDIFTLDLNEMSYAQDFRLTYAIREGLYVPAPDTLIPEPTGAISHEISEDKKTWTFHLRKEARWSNGDPVTSRDYLFSWRRMLEQPGEYTYLFHYIHNAEKYEESYKAGRPIPFSEVGIEAPDDYTFRVTLDNPVTYFLELVAFPPFYPRHEKSMIPFRQFTDEEIVKSVVPDDLRGTLTELELIDYIQKNAKANAELPDEKMAYADWTKDQKIAAMAKYGYVRFTYDPRYTRPPGVVTNGPFRLTDWAFKQYLYLAKSDNYWDKDRVKVNSIEMRVNDNTLSQFLQYEAGAIDWMADVNADLAADLYAKGRKDLHTSTSFTTYFLTLLVKPNLPKSILNGAANPLADIRVRQALAMSIDKQGICTNITRMGDKVATTYFPPGTLPGFDVAPGLGFDIAKAKELLAAAGYPNGANFPAIPILYNSENPTRAKVAQYLKQQWRQNLNIDLPIDSIEGKIYKTRISGQEYAIGLAAWSGDYPDVSTFTDKYLSTSLQNDAAWKNAKYDDLCAQAAREGDVPKRMELLRQAEALIDTEVPIVPLYHPMSVTMSPAGVNGVLPNARGVTVFKGISIDRNLRKGGGQ